MRDKARTISYFTVWGLIYGVLLGAFAGTAILPYFGTIYSTIWGGGIGLASGILSGVVAALFPFNRDTDLDGFRRRLALSLGTLIAVAAPLMLVASTNGFLWGSGLLRDMAPWSVLSFFAAAFWGGLSAAYIGSHYPSYIARLTAMREYADSDIELPEARREVVINAQVLLRAAFNRWVFLIGGLAGGTANLISWGNFLINYSGSAPSIADILTYGGLGMILGMIMTLPAGLYVAIGNAALITFLKRLIFREYFSSLPPHWTRRILTLTAFVFTGAVTYWSLVFAPLIAFITAFYVYRTLALPDEPIDKAKRKEKNALALEESIEDVDDVLIDEEAVIEERLQR